MSCDEVISQLKGLAEPNYVEKMAYFKSDTSNAFGIRIPELRKLAKSIGKNHPLAMELWATEIHEARILASMIADYKQFDEALFDSWVADFKSWDLCDQCCFNVLEKVNLAQDKIELYAYESSEFKKRTAFTLIAGMAIHNKKIPNEQFTTYLGLIERHSDDDRNFVKKAVNWALRQIGKRNEYLRIKAIETSIRIEQQATKSAKWIAKDALRELQSTKTIDFISKHRN